MKKKFLVTGAYGFIGSHFVDYLDNKVNADVHIIDKYGYASNKGNLQEDYNTINVIHHNFDLAEKGKAFTLFENDKLKFDAIFHFAAESHVDNSIKGPSLFVESNVLGTQYLLEAWRRTGAHGRFIHISTDEVYGHLHETDSPFTESTPLDPRSPYSASKASSDLLVKAYHDTYGLNTIITRCCNNYGPKQHHEKLIPKTITNILTNKKVPIYGSGKNIREWIHVLDHVAAVWSLYTQGNAGNVYNIGTGNEMTNIFLVKTICTHLGVNFDDVVEFVEDRKGHDFRYAINSTKIKQLTDWTPKYEFDKGIKETIEYYRQSPSF